MAPGTHRRSSDGLSPHDKRERRRGGQSGTLSQPTEYRVHRHDRRGRIHGRNCQNGDDLCDLWTVSVETSWLGIANGVPKPSLGAQHQVSAP